MNRNIILPFALALMAFGSTGCGNSAKKANSEIVAEDSTATSDSTRMQLDGVNVTWVCDNASEKLMSTDLFLNVPDGLIESLGLQNGVPSTVSTFLVETGGITILFDTGIGQRNGNMLNKLAETGVRPEDIRYLYLTHFHGDHIGGMMNGDSVVFPNAEVYASKVEYGAWMAMPSSKNGLQAKTMKAYADKLHLFEFGDTLPGNVVTIDATGHTPGHTAFRAGKLLVVGDIIHGAALQLKNPDISTSYDMDPKAAADARKRILKYAEDNDLVMAGMHLPAPAFIK